MINTITPTYEILGNEKANRIDCKVFYDKGGYNPWQNSKEGRGYWFSIGEWTLENHDGVLFRKYVISTCGRNGMKCLIEPVPRQSKKRYEIAKARLNEFISRFLEPYCNEHGYELGQIVSETEEER